MHGLTKASLVFPPSQACHPVSKYWGMDPKDEKQTLCQLCNQLILLQPAQPTYPNTWIMSSVTWTPSMAYLQIISSIALSTGISQCADQGFCCIDNKHSTDYEFCHINIKHSLWPLFLCKLSGLFSKNKILPSFALGLYWQWNDQLQEPHELPSLWQERCWRQSLSYQRLSQTWQPYDLSLLNPPLRNACLLHPSGNASWGYKP